MSCNIYTSRLTSVLDLSLDIRAFLDNMPAATSVARGCLSRMSIYKRLRYCYTLYGVPAVSAISVYRLLGLGMPREIKARAAGIKYPVCIRLNTTDTILYKDVLLNEQYAIDLPFSPTTIVDAGANIGMAAVYYANKYPTARIVAIEPEASNFAVLLRNIERYPNIVAIQAALWNKDGQVKVGGRDPDRRAGHWAYVTREHNGIPVRAITMRTLMSEMNLDFVDILKVDIEGAEKEVFDRCDWLNRVRVVAIELHDRFKPGCSAAVNSATWQFSKSQRGEIIFYLRNS